MQVNCTLTSLDLASNSVRAGGAIFIGEALKVCVTPHSFDVCANSDDCAGQ